MKGQKRRPFSPVLAAFVLSLLFVFTFARHASASYVSWEDGTNKRFNHMTVDDSTGKVYVGAVNRIYHLTRDLNLRASVVMGPQDDSPQCPATRICPQIVKSPTDYYNKALLIDSSGRKLIACGSLFQGGCTVHNLNDITTFNTPTNEAVVADNDVASTVAFIAPGPKTLNRTGVLYVGVSFTGSSPYRSDVPAVSSRRLDPNNMFALPPLGGRMRVNSLSREIYPITYIYGFSSNGFSYFVTVQKQSNNSPSPFISKLVRICQDDDDYYSYTEVPLSCKTRDGTYYNLAQAAYVGSPGSELAKSLEISKQDSVLFAVFSKSRDEDNADSDPSQNSALCVYSLDGIRGKFKQNIQHCFSGNGERGLDFITPNFHCITTRLQIDDDFCGFDVNTPLGGTIPIQAAPILRFPGILLTAVAATSTHDYTVAFLGTSSGHLKKVVVETATTATEYSDIVIEEGSPVNADMLFDKEKNYIYVMTERKVTKVKVHDCDVFRTCADCIGAHDPYCGWCSFENRCLSRKACSDTDNDSLCWLSYKRNRCYVFTEVQLPARNVTSSEEEGAETAKGHPDRPTNERVHGFRKAEHVKLQTLQDIAQSMRNIDSSIKELIELQKAKEVV